MNFKKTLLSAALAIVASTAVANATILTVFDGIAAGRSSFDSTVTGAGGTVSSDVLTGLGTGTSIDRGDYTITRNNGGSISPDFYGTMSGEVININPSGGGSSPRTDPMDYFVSGITMTFNSAINSIGFEIGDWATCCMDPTTDLFISFDDGLPILVASASSFLDGQFPSQADPLSSVFEIFVAAFDDSGDFTKVSFWGNGIGEFLVFGGDVRYALLDQGSLPPNADVPVPASGLLLMGALGAAAFVRRRKAQA
jgi:hypothetical protein